MNYKEINIKLSKNNLDIISLFPHLVRLKEVPYVFKQDFGLKELPSEPGILLIRGVRQFEEFLLE